MRAKLSFDAWCVASLLILQGVPGWAQEATRFRMEGVVQDEGTSRPVPGVTVQVLIESGRAIDERLLSAITDQRGRYAISVPVGHAVAWTLLPPPGYSAAKSYHIESFATTDDQPVFKKDYQVRKGVAWKIVVRSSDTTTPLPKTYVSGGQQRENEYVSAFCELEPQGRGVLTLPDLGGEFSVSCADAQRTLIAPDAMKLSIEKGFRTDQVATAKLLESGGTELRDRDGRVATVLGFSVEVQEEAAALVIPVRVRPAADRGAIVGRVVDAGGQSIAGAKVAAALHSGGGSAMNEFTATTSAEGVFRLLMPDLQADFQVSLVITAEGYGGLDSEPRKIDLTKSKETDIGWIKLSPGSSIPIRVVGPKGEPLEGAIVEPVGSYAARAGIVRSGKDGLCTLKNLSAGVHAFSARFGNLTSSSKIPVAAGENELLVVKLSSPRTESPAATERPVAALAKGADAPAWEIAEWTDGQPRKLSDYQGKVVVLDFWGVWCGPCINSIPAMKQLHDRYAERDVVFFGIHSAGTDMTLVKRLLKQQEWNAITGLDVGDDIVSGKTVQSFAIRGFPTVIIVDRQGKVAHNSGDIPADREKFMKEMERFVKEAGLPWPLDEGVTKEELQERLTKLNVVLFSREIDRALEAPPK